MDNKDEMSYTESDLILKPDTEEHKVSETSEKIINGIIACEDPNESSLLNSIVEAVMRGDMNEVVALALSHRNIDSKDRGFVDQALSTALRNKFRCDQMKELDKQNDNESKVKVSEGEDEVSESKIHLNASSTVYSSMMKSDEGNEVQCAYYVDSSSIDESTKNNTFCQTGFHTQSVDIENQSDDQTNGNFPQYQAFTSSYQKLENINSVKTSQQSVQVQLPGIGNFLLQLPSNFKPGEPITLPISLPLTPASQSSVGNPISINMSTGQIVPNQLLSLYNPSCINNIAIGKKMRAIAPKPSKPTYRQPLIAPKTDSPNVSPYNQDCTNMANSTLPAPSGPGRRKGAKGKKVGRKRGPQPKSRKDSSYASSTHSIDSQDTIQFNDSNNTLKQNCNNFISSRNTYQCNYYVNSDSSDYINQTHLIPHSFNELQSNNIIDTSDSGEKDLLSLAWEISNADLGNNDDFNTTYQLYDSNNMGSESFVSSEILDQFLQNIQKDDMSDLSRCSSAQINLDSRVSYASSFTPLPPCSTVLPSVTTSNYLNNSSNNQTNLELSQCIEIAEVVNLNTEDMLSELEKDESALLDKFVAQYSSSTACSLSNQTGILKYRNQGSEMNFRENKSDFSEKDLDPNTKDSNELSEIAKQIEKDCDISNMSNSSMCRNYLSRNDYDYHKDGDQLNKFNVNSTNNSHNAFIQSKSGNFCGSVTTSMDLIYSTTTDTFNSTVTDRTSHYVIPVNMDAKLQSEATYYITNGSLKSKTLDDFGLLDFCSENGDKNQYNETDSLDDKRYLEPPILEDISDASPIPSDDESVDEDIDLCAFKLSTFNHLNLISNRVYPNRIGNINDVWSTYKVNDLLSLLDMSQLESQSFSLDKWYVYDNFINICDTFSNVRIENEEEETSCNEVCNERKNVEDENDQNKFVDKNIKVNPSRHRQSKNGFKISSDLQNMNKRKLNGYNSDHTNYGRVGKNIKSRGNSENQDKHGKTLKSQNKVQYSPKYREVKRYTKQSKNFMIEAKNVVKLKEPRFHSRVRGNTKIDLSEQSKQRKNYKNNVAINACEENHFKVKDRVKEIVVKYKETKLSLNEHIVKDSFTKASCSLNYKDDLNKQNDIAAINLESVDNSFVYENKHETNVDSYLESKDIDVSIKSSKSKKSETKKNDFKVIKGCSSKDTNVFIEFNKQVNNKTKKEVVTNLISKSDFDVNFDEDNARGLSKFINDSLSNSIQIEEFENSKPDKSIKKAENVDLENKILNDKEAALGDGVECMGHISILETARNHLDDGIRTGNNNNIRFENKTVFSENIDSETNNNIELKKNEIIRRNINISLNNNKKNENHGKMVDRFHIARFGNEVKLNQEAEMISDMEACIIKNNQDNLENGMAKEQSEGTMYIDLNSKNNTIGSKLNAINSMKPENAITTNQDKYISSTAKKEFIQNHKMKISFTNSFNAKNDKERITTRNNAKQMKANIVAITEERNSRKGNKNSQHDIEVGDYKDRRSRLRKPPSKLAIYQSIKFVDNEFADNNMSEVQSIKDLESNKLKKEVNKPSKSIHNSKINHCTRSMGLISKSYDSFYETLEKTKRNQHSKLNKLKNNLKRKRKNLTNENNNKECEHLKNLIVNNTYILESQLPLPETTHLHHIQNNESLYKGTVILKTRKGKQMQNLPKKYNLRKPSDVKHEIPKMIGEKKSVNSNLKNALRPKSLKTNSVIICEDKNKKQENCIDSDRIRRAEVFEFNYPYDILTESNLETQCKIDVFQSMYCELHKASIKNNDLMSPNIIDVMQKNHTSERNKNEDVLKKSFPVRKINRKLRLLSGLEYENHIKHSKLLDVPVFEFLTEYKINFQIIEFTTFINPLISGPDCKYLSIKEMESKVEYQVFESNDEDFDDADSCDARLVIVENEDILTETAVDTAKSISARVNSPINTSIQGENNDFCAIYRQPMGNTECIISEDDSSITIVTKRLQREVSSEKTLDLTVNIEMATVVPENDNIERLNYDSFYNTRKELSNLKSNNEYGTNGTESDLNWNEERNFKVSRAETFNHTPVSNNEESDYDQRSNSESLTSDNNNENENKDEDSKNPDMEEILDNTLCDIQGEVNLKLSKDEEIDVSKMYLLKNKSKEVIEISTAESNKPINLRQNSYEGLKSVQTGITLEDLIVNDNDLIGVKFLNEPLNLTEKVINHNIFEKSGSLSEKKQYELDKGSVDISDTVERNGFQNSWPLYFDNDIIKVQTKEEISSKILKRIKENRLKLKIYRNHLRCIWQTKSHKETNYSVRLKRNFLKRKLINGPNISDNLILIENGIANMNFDPGDVTKHEDDNDNTCIEVNDDVSDNKLCSIVDSNNFETYSRSYGSFSLKIKFQKQDPIESLNNKPQETRKRKKGSKKRKKLRHFLNSIIASNDTVSNNYNSGYESLDEESNYDSKCNSTRKRKHSSTTIGSIDSSNQENINQNDIPPKLTPESFVNDDDDYEHQKPIKIKLFKSTNDDCSKSEEMIFSLQKSNSKDSKEKSSVPKMLQVLKDQQFKPCRQAANLANKKIFSTAKEDRRSQNATLTSIWNQRKVNVLNKLPTDFINRCNDRRRKPRGRPPKAPHLSLFSDKYNSNTGSLKLKIRLSKDFKNSNDDNLSSNGENSGRTSTNDSSILNSAVAGINGPSDALSLESNNFINGITQQLDENIDYLEAKEAKVYFDPNQVDIEKIKNSYYSNKKNNSINFDGVSQQNLYDDSPSELCDEKKNNISVTNQEFSGYNDNDSSVSYNNLSNAYNCNNKVSHLPKDLINISENCYGTNREPQDLSQANQSYSFNNEITSPEKNQFDLWQSSKSNSAELLSTCINGNNAWFQKHRSFPNSNSILYDSYLTPNIKDAKGCVSQNQNQPFMVCENETSDTKQVETSLAKQSLGKEGRKSSSNLFESHNQLSPNQSRGVIGNVPPQLNIHNWADETSHNTSLNHTAAAWMTYAQQQAAAAAYMDPQMKAYYNLALSQSMLNNPYCGAYGNPAGNPENFYSSLHSQYLNNSKELIEKNHSTGTIRNHNDTMGTFMEAAQISSWEHFYSAAAMANYHNSSQGAMDEYAGRAGTMLQAHHMLSGGYPSSVLARDHFSIDNNKPPVAHQNQSGSASPMKSNSSPTPISTAQAYPHVQMPYSHFNGFF